MTGPDCHATLAVANNVKGSSRQFLQPVLPLFAALVLVPACRTTVPRFSAEQREKVQTAVTMHFESAVLFKPNQSGFDQPLEVQLAPLLILESSLPTTNPVPPAVECRPGIVLIHNRWHRQFTYTWILSDFEPPNATRGIRLILDSNDSPVIWELLGNDGDPRIYYVASSIEHLAKAEFGEPAPGRKFAVEQDLITAPKVIVANTIEDNPVSFGPIVYLEHPSRKAVAVICRCMPAQMNQLVGQAEYLLRLHPAEHPSRHVTKTKLMDDLRLPDRF